MKPLILSAATLAVISALFLLIPERSALPSAVAAGSEVHCALADGPEYIGADGCKKCHFKQWMSWKKTEMAKTFDVLKPGEKKEEKVAAKLDPAKDYTKDAKCLECHTTGYGKPGGYPALVEGKTWTEEQTKLAAEREGVQCESCHGPGSQYSPYKKDNEDYKIDDILKMGLVHPNKDNCVSCHNERNPTQAKDATFDYEKAVKDDKKIHTHVELKKKH